MASTSALKLTPASTPSKLGSKKDVSPDTTPANSAKPTTVTNPADISSPHELTAYVETLLENLDAKFDDMSSQILDRMMQMSSRVDALEASLQDIINGDGASSSAPQSPSAGSSSTTPVPGAGPRRSGGSS